MHKRINDSLTFIFYALFSQLILHCILEGSVVGILINSGRSGVFQEDAKGREITNIRWVIGCNFIIIIFF